MDVFQLILQNLHFKNTFFRGHLRATFWYLENFTFKLLLINKFVHSINTVGTLYFWVETQILLKHNSLKSLFQSYIIPCFLGSRFFRVQVFQISGPGFRSSLIKLHFKKIQVQIQVCKESNISVYVTIILFVHFSLKNFKPAKWNEINFTLNRKNLNKIHDNEGMCNTKVTGILFYVYRPYIFA